MSPPPPDAPPPDTPRTTEGHLPPTSLRRGVIAYVVTGLAVVAVAGLVAVSCDTGTDDTGETSTTETGEATDTAESTETSEATETGEATGTSTTQATGGAASDAGAIPTPEQLAERLLTVDDLDGVWSVDPGPDEAMALDGVITPEQSELLPRLDLCEDASPEAQTTALELGWQAFRQLNLEVDDPVNPPLDPTGRLVAVQEFLLADDPAVVESTFNELRDGQLACLGEIPAGEEGPGRATEVDLAPVGDDSVAVLLEFEEAGGGGMWNITSVLVRQGPILLGLTIGDVWLGELETIFESGDIDAIVTAAMERL